MKIRVAAAQEKKSKIKEENLSHLWHKLKILQLSDYCQLLKEVFHHKN